MMVACVEFHDFSGLYALGFGGGVIIGFVYSRIVADLYQTTWSRLSWGL